MDMPKVLYIHTIGTETPERTATPFYLAATGALSDMDVTIIFTMKGTGLLKKGVAETIHVKEGGDVNLRYFIEQAKESGVKFLVCAASLDLNEMRKEDLIDEVDDIIGGATINDMALEADAVLTF